MSMCVKGALETATVGTSVPDIPHLTPILIYWVSWSVHLNVAKQRTFRTHAHMFPLSLSPSSDARPAHPHTPLLATLLSPPFSPVVTPFLLPLIAGSKTLPPWCSNALASTPSSPPSPSPLEDPRRCSLQASAFVLTSVPTWHLSRAV